MACRTVEAPCPVCGAMGIQRRYVGVMGHGGIRHECYADGRDWHEKLRRLLWESGDLAETIREKLQLIEQGILPGSMLEELRQEIEVLRKQRAELNARCAHLRKVRSLEDCPT